MKHLVFGRTQVLHIQFLRYFFVGGTAAVIDLFIFAVLIKYAGLHYLSAAFLAYMVGLGWNYIISIIWVFESRHGRAKEVLMVFLIALGGLFWTEVILYGFIGFLAFNPIIAKMVSQILVLFWNFGMRKMYVFH